MNHHLFRILVYTLNNYYGYDLSDDYYDNVMSQETLTFKNYVANKFMKALEDNRLDLLESAYYRATKQLDHIACNPYIVD